MNVITFDTLAECKDALKLINKAMGFPNENTLTWDEPHKTFKGLFFINKPNEEYLVGVTYSELSIKKDDIANEIPQSLLIDETGLLKVNNKYSIIKRVENYRQKTIEVTYSINGVKKEFTIDASSLTATVNGYGLDLTNEIKNNTSQLK